MEPKVPPPSLVSQSQPPVPRRASYKRKLPELVIDSYSSSEGEGVKAKQASLPPAKSSPKKQTKVDKAKKRPAPVLNHTYKEDLVDGESSTSTGEESKHRAAPPRKREEADIGILTGKVEKQASAKRATVPTSQLPDHKVRSSCNCVLF